jgi:hypothetical protein
MGRAERPEVPEPQYMVVPGAGMLAAEREALAGDAITVDRRTKAITIVIR